MNASRPQSFVPVSAPAPHAPAACFARNERGFGIGYGRSSGYAAPTRGYAARPALPQFRFA